MHGAKVPREPEWPARPIETVVSIGGLPGWQAKISPLKIRRPQVHATLLAARRSNPGTPRGVPSGCASLMPTSGGPDLLPVPRSRAARIRAAQRLRIPVVTHCGCMAPAALHRIPMSVHISGLSRVSLGHRVISPLEILAGSVPALPLDRARRLASVTRATLRTQGSTGLVLPSSRAPAYYDQVSYQSPSMLLVGEERHGMSPAQRRICTTTVRIPMAPQCDSLNVAVAGSLLLYQITRQLLR